MDPIKAAKAALYAACKAYSISRAGNLSTAAADFTAVVTANLALKQAVAAKARRVKCTGHHYGSCGAACGAK